ncbi:hypothetical protein Q0F98_39010 [Paenibacillus amylolyticus]|nr:hypothetical protein Q0F98_39010 [Paenibacillus amylolyticus]
MLMNASDPPEYVYNPQHEFSEKYGQGMEEILGSIHRQLDIMPQESPLQVKVGDQSFYALYRYIAPLNTYVVDIASHQALMKGPTQLVCICGNDYIMCIAADYATRIPNDAAHFPAVGQRTGIHASGTERRAGCND